MNLTKNTVGMMLNFIVTLITRLTPAPPVAIQQLVDDLRTPEPPPLTLSNLKEKQSDEFKTY